MQQQLGTLSENCTQAVATSIVISKNVKVISAFQRLCASCLSQKAPSALYPIYFVRASQGSKCHKMYESQKKCLYLKMDLGPFGSEPRFLTLKSYSECSKINILFLTIIKFLNAICLRPAMFANNHFSDFILFRNRSEITAEGV